MKKIKIGLIGLGTVGCGVFKTLKNFDNIEIKKIAVKNISKKRNIEDLDESLLTDNPYDIVNDAEIKIVVEVVGGLEPAFDLISTAIKNGKHVVCANKEMLAKKGKELFELSQQYNRVILYEAAVAGGIPIITPLKTILSANRISKVAGILNGTTNYILTKMAEDKVSYEQVLKEAQDLGYAEANPTGDVEGFDAAYKLATLASLAFNKRIDINDIYREGITKLGAEDMIYAKELGYKIKLIALASIDNDNRADVRVHPMLVNKKNSLAHIDNVTNAVVLKGEPVGEIMFFGPGAGEFPTASSVVGDILTLAAELETTDYPLPLMRCKHEDNSVVVNISDTYNKYYMSINAKNKIGVIASLGRIFAENSISISTLLQKGLRDDNTANIIVITENSKENDIQKAIKELSEDGCVNKINNILRVMD